MSIAYSNFYVYFKKQFGEKNIIIMLKKFIRYFFKYNNPELIMFSAIKDKEDLGYEIIITTRQVPSLKIRKTFMRFCRENGYLKKDKIIKISKIKHKVITKKSLL